LPSARKRHSAKVILCRVSCLCRVSGTRQRWLCRVSTLCRVFWVWHSAKGVFAECPIYGTRQRSQHSALLSFLVVNIQGPHLMDFTSIKSERGHRNNGRFLFIAHELAQTCCRNKLPQLTCLNLRTVHSF